MIIGLAPMDGYTDCAFRQIVKEIFDVYGEKEIYELGLWTEFMNADGYIINPPGVIKHLLTDKDQLPVIAQIFGSDENMLMKCFADIQKKYFLNAEFRIQNAEKNKKKSINSELGTLNSEFIFAGIELNMGCPARNVMHTGGGSALLRERTQTLEIIKKLSGIMKMPFSVKTRTGKDENDLDEQMKFLVEISSYVSMITIHGRTVKQGYAADSNWDFVYELKKQSDKKCKILGNGGIKVYEDIGKFLHCHSDPVLATREESSKNSLYPSLHSGGQSECLDGVMIGQGAIGNPRIFTPHIPNREEIQATILKHLDYMISYENYFQEQKTKYKSILVMPEHLKINIKKPQAITLAEFRKHLFQYVKGIPGSKEFKQKVSTISEYNQLVEEIQKFFSL
ncbi:MAG: tRNA-dihydrouridine synthase [candidate division SR1 bacterium]|nr:tRNA-dihydrouridine synthase [candidate division SR1 bacterium]